MIAYYTKFTTVPENRSTFVALLTEAAQAMSTVEGCKLYEVALDAENAAVTVVTEIWTDEEAHDASLQTDEAKAIIAQAMPLMAGMPKQYKFGPVTSNL